MSKFFITLMNLEVDEINAEEAGTRGALDIVTMHIMDYLGDDFQMVVTNLPIKVDAIPDETYPYPSIHREGRDA